MLMLLYFNGQQSVSELAALTWASRNQKRQNFENERLFQSV